MIAAALLAGLWLQVPAGDVAAGRALYEQRCLWCHGPNGRGDGPSATEMWPRPRDFTRAHYRIRSTPHGQLPTDADLFRAISEGLPGTPMPGWAPILGDADRWHLVAYLKSLSPRFRAESPAPIAIPEGAASVERGKAVYQQARCFLCHGDEGRGDGGITTTLDSQWGHPHRARDFTRGWTFKGGHTPADLYRRITGGLAGTPMGPYADLLGDQERWDLAHYVASLDAEPRESSDDFLVAATHVAGALPDDPGAEVWGHARVAFVSLAGQVIATPHSRWWTPTVGTAAVRALWNGDTIAFLVEWDDPTESRAPRADSAFLQFALAPDARPYLVWGDAEHPVACWQWQAPAGAGPPALQELHAQGAAAIQSRPARFEAAGRWDRGRWRVVFRRSLAGEPAFRPGAFLPFLVSIRDGDNGESGDRRATSTWLYVTAVAPGSSRPWLLGLAWALGVALVEAWFLRRVAR